jgi:hypothetical protein
VELSVTASNTGVTTFTASGAVFVTPAYVAEIVAMLFVVTGDVVMTKVPTLAPASTVTLAGTFANEESDASATTAPLLGAGKASCTTPFTCIPALTAEGLTETDDSQFTIDRTTDFELPPHVTVIVTDSFPFGSGFGVVIGTTTEELPS